MRGAGHVACMKGRGELHTEFWEAKPEGKRPLGRPRHRWEDNIQMELQELDLGGGAQTGLNWLRIGAGGGGTCKRRNEP